MSQNYKQLQKAYWSKRLYPARNYGLFMTEMHTYFAIRELFFNDSGMETSMLIIFIQCIIANLLVLPSYWKKDLEWLVRLGQMLCSILPLEHAILSAIFLDKAVSDLEGAEQAAVQAVAVCLKLIVSMIFFNFHIQNFDLTLPGHRLFGLMYLLYLVIALHICLFGLSAGVITTFTIGIVIVIPLGMLLVKNQTAHMDHVRKMLKNISDQEFLRLVLNTNQAALAILNEDCKITFSNEVFARMFKDQIEWALHYTGSTLSQSMHSEQGILNDDQAEKSRVPSWRAWLKRDSSKKKPKKKKEQETDNELTEIQPFSQQAAEQENFENNFYAAPLFEVKDSSENNMKYCFADLVRNPDLAAQKTFLICDFLPQALPCDASTKRYVRLEIQSLIYLEQRRLLIQIIDVSDSVFYDISKEQNEMLSILNATVSHELRNPLNAIAGQNIQKEGLMSKLETIAEGLKASDLEDTRLQGDHIIQLLSKMHDSLHVQTSSTQMMSFLVQDFLDFAQIKSGKFRKNIKPFNVMETIDKVISIQQLKAEESGISLEANYKEIQDASSGEPPVLFCDEQRIMQVLLNLVSNALKFTQDGRVSVKAKIEDDKEAKFLKVAVSDTGVGIPYEDQGKLFKLFGFVTSTQQYNRNGIGLGLMISKQIVTKFEGNIDFTSVPKPEEDHGTTFTFTFKLQSEAEYLELRAKEESLGSKYTLNSKQLVFEEQGKSVRRRVSSHGQELSQSHNSAIQTEECLSHVPNQSRLRAQQYTLNLSDEESQCDFIHTSPPRARERSFFSKERKPEIKKKILIVDDQIFNIQALMAIFEHRFNISEDQLDYALNGEEALRKIKEDMVLNPVLPNSNSSDRFDPDLVPSTYPLILMDCNMPFMDGYECTQLIREHFAAQYAAPITQQPIISAVTGHVEKQYIQKCFEKGMNQVLSKPVEEEPLLAACICAGLTTLEKVTQFKFSKKRKSRK